MSFGQGPRRVEIHARTAQRRSDDGEDHERHDEAGIDRDHPLARASRRRVACTSITSTTGRISITAIGMM